MCPIKIPNEEGSLACVLFYCCKISVFQRIQIKTIFNVIIKADKQHLKIQVHSSVAKMIAHKQLKKLLYSKFICVC